MNPEIFAQKLEEQGIKLTEKQLKQFEIYFRMLVEWNEKINLTAIVEKDEVYLKHFYDSLSLGFYINDLDESSLCDVGAGAGFPSIPLKIIYPNLQVTIVDSLNKRITFLTELVKALELEGVQLYHDRAETFGQNKDHREMYDIVTARAVARMSVLSELCLPLVKKGGRFLAMKASEADNELDDAKNAIAKLGGKYVEDIAFELPEEAGERHIFVIEKRKETPKKYPRKPGTPNKNPIK